MQNFSELDDIDRYSGQCLHGSEYYSPKALVGENR